jgi:hypothetical protein
MKKFNLYLALLFLPLGLFANDDDQKKEFVKEINKVFDMDRKGELSIVNKHGKVDIKTWDKPEVKIEIKIIVQAKDGDRAEEIFERINVAFNNDVDYVKAVTDIKSKKGSWSQWSSWGTASSRDEFEINYEVSMPNDGRLDVRNKYGDTYVAVTDGPVNAEVGYGSIRFEGVNNELKLYLGYGDATIIMAESVSAEVNYSKIGIRNAGEADLNTKYSKINMEKVGSARVVTKYDEFNIYEVGTMRVEGKYGKFNINQINKLVANGKYTDYIIGSLKSEADVVLSYGGLSIESLKKGFDNVRLDGSYVNFKIVTDPGIDYKVDASASYGDVKLPENMKNTYKRDSGYSYKVEGIVGEGTPTSIIKVKVNYGDVRIR